MIYGAGGGSAMAGVGLVAAGVALTSGGGRSLVDTVCSGVKKCATALACAAKKLATTAADIVSPKPSTGRASTAHTTVQPAKSLSDTASKYGLYECKEAAEAMAKQNNNKGYLINLLFENAIGGNVCAPKSKYGWKTAISQNGSHWGYCDEFNIVRCNVFPLGLPESEWIRSFEDAYNSTPIVTRIPIY